MFLRYHSAVSVKTAQNPIVRPKLKKAHAYAEVQVQCTGIYNIIFVSLHLCSTIEFELFKYFSYYSMSQKYISHSRLPTYGWVSRVKFAFILRPVDRFQVRQTNTCLAVCPDRKHSQKVARTCECTNKKIPHRQSLIFPSPIIRIWKRSKTDQGHLSCSHDNSLYGNTNKVSSVKISSLYIVNWRF